MILSANIKNGKLTIEMECNKKPVESKSGKTMIVATTGAPQPVGVVVNNQALKIACTAFIQKG